MRYLYRVGGQMLGLTLLMVAVSIAVGFLASRVSAAIGRDPVSYTHLARSGTRRHTNRTISGVNGSHTSVHTTLNKVCAFAICRAITASSGPLGESAAVSRTYNGRPAQNTAAPVRLNLSLIHI